MGQTATDRPSTSLHDESLNGHLRFSGSPSLLTCDTALSVKTLKSGSAMERLPFETLKQIFEYVGDHGLYGKHPKS